MQSSTSCSEIKIPHAEHVRSQPSFLFGMVIFAALALLLSRGTLSPQVSPVFSLPTTTGMRILLGDGFPDPGIHQYSDGMTIRGVIELTGAVTTDSGVLSDLSEIAGAIDGMALEVVDSGTEHGHVVIGWMTARQRLALGIPLHPDRMSRDDWVTLPGIGEKLAAQIELDRQKFGDFGDFEALDRVKGIGPAKLKTLRPFFVNNDNLL